MAWAALILIVVAFGGMALAFARSERAEERRILARAEAVLARGGTTLFVPEREQGESVAAPAAPELRRVA
jgi:hypothetical protein